jgi:hypothetical protein
VSLGEFAFQACSFNHSDISPFEWINSLPACVIRANQSNRWPRSATANLYERREHASIAEGPSVSAADPRVPSAQRAAGTGPGAGRCPCAAVAIRPFV